MKTLENCSEIRELAAKIGVFPADSPQDIVNWCLNRVAEWVLEEGCVQNSGQLEALICKNLATIFEEIHSEADIARLKAKFASLGRILCLGGLKGILQPNANRVKIWRSNGQWIWRSRLICKLPLF